MRQSDGVDHKKRYFRAAERFFQADGRWYFAAREGDQGRYRSRENAEREAYAFIQSPPALRQGPKQARWSERYNIPLYRHVLGLSIEQPKFEELVIQFDD